MKKAVSLDLYKKLYLIRKSEEAIIKDYAEDVMKTPMHMSMGEEAITVGVCSALTTKTLYFGTYRSHALYLSITNDTNGFFAEMYGKETGVIKGKGGSMHLSFPEKGLLSTSAVVASTIPLAVGAAFGEYYNNGKKISVVFFGDGAIDEGVFWESLNMACLKKLPVLFVCCDNGYAVHTPPEKRHGYKSITDIVSKFNCLVFKNEHTTDVEEIYSIANEASMAIKKKGQPAFLYLKYYRYLEHVGVYEDFKAGYRSKKEFEKWLKVDPVSIQRKRLLRLGISEKKISGVEKKIDHEIISSVDFAKKSPFPAKLEILKDVYYET